MYRLVFRERERQGEGKSRLIWGKPNKAGRGALKPLYTGLRWSVAQQPHSKWLQQWDGPVNFPLNPQNGTGTAPSVHGLIMKPLPTAETPFPRPRSRAAVWQEAFPSSCKAPRGMSPCSGSTSLRPHVAPIPSAAQAAATSPGSQLESL